MDVIERTSTPQIAGGRKGGRRKRYDRRTWRLALRKDAFKALCDRAGWDTQERAAVGIGVAVATVHRIGRGRISADFIEAALGTFGPMFGAKFDDLFTLVPVEDDRQADVA